jgi:hypothetical protein
MPTSLTSKMLIADDGTSRAEGKREEIRHFDFNSSSSSSLSPPGKNTQKQNVTSEVTGRPSKLSAPFMSQYSNGHSSSKIKNAEEEEDLSILTASSSILLQLRRNQQQEQTAQQREGTGIHSSPLIHDAINTAVSDSMENMDNSTNSAAEVKNYVNNNNKVLPTQHFNFTRENFLHDRLVASTNDNFPNMNQQYQYQRQHQLFNNPYSHAGARSSSEHMPSSAGASSYLSFLGGFRNQDQDHDTVNDFYQRDRQYMMQNQQHNSSSSFLSRPQGQREILERGEAHPRSNLYKMSSIMNMIHSNGGPYSQIYHPHLISSIDGMSMNQFQISNESLIYPDSREEHPFHPSSRSDRNNLAAVPTEIHHSSDHTRKTFSLQKIYRALNRHLLGVGNEEDNKPNENILVGIRREGSLSDNHRSIIKPSSRKRSNDESNEYTTEITSTTKSSSMKSSYPERIIPSDILRADSNSYAQSNHFVYHLNPSNLERDPYGTTITNHHHHHHHVTHRYCAPIMMGVPTDADHISKFLQFLRAECCQVFTAGLDEVNERRTSKPVQIHQVGIRCAFCAHKPYSERAPRSSCYPSCFNRIYQSVVMMVRDHFSVCPHFPPEVRKTYVSIKACSRRRRDVDSKQYWAISFKALRIVETDMGLFFQRP